MQLYHAVLYETLSYYTYRLMMYLPLPFEIDWVRHMLTDSDTSPASHLSDVTKRFLLAAKHAEIHVLEQLSSNCRIVIAVKHVVHALQRERGASNIYIASKGTRFAAQRNTHIQSAIAAEDNLRSQLKSLFLTNKTVDGNPRLLSSVTLALQGIDYLPVLRDKISSLSLSALESTRAYCRLVAGLLTVIFEAADIASDPTITRMLVALFNLMQGKEYAGQERAWGAIGFAETHFDTRLCDKLSTLQQAQQHHFSVFNEFSTKPQRQLLAQLDSSPASHDVMQLRNMIAQLADGSPIAPEISEVWFDVATRRIDAMEDIEDTLTEGLVKAAKRKVTNAQEEMTNHQRLIESFSDEHVPEGSPLTLLFDPSMPGLVDDHSPHINGHELDTQAEALSAHRSFYDLLQGQAQYIKDMTKELEDAKRAITEHKLTDRAKLILMQQFQLSEHDAYRRLQKQAMNENASLASIAQKVVDIAQQSRPKSAAKYRG